MAISTWVTEVKSRDVLNKLINMVQKRELEEIFLSQIDVDGAVMQHLKKGAIIAIISTKAVTIPKGVKALGKAVLLDDLDDDMFDIDDEGAALKGVIYPESEDEELSMLETLT